MTSKQERIVFLFMTMNAIAFVILFFWLSSNYRLAADDFHYLITTSENGIWGSMLYYYNNWNPRWSSTLVTSFAVSGGNSTVTILLYYLATFSFGVVSFYSFLTSIVSRFQLPINRKRQVIISIYLLAGLFYGSFSKDQTWFWITVNPMYLWGSFAAVLGGSFIIQNWVKPLRTASTSLLFLYACGASETVAISVLIALFFLGFLTKKRQFLISIDRTALHFATVSCMIGFGIDLLGPGAHIRFDHLPQYSFMDKTIVGFWNYAKLSLKEIPMVIPAFIIMSAPFAFLGRKHLRFQLISLRDLVLVDRKLWIVADVMVITLSFALAYSMGGIGPERAWLPISFMVLVFSLVLAYQLGTWIYIKSNGKLFHLVVAAQIIGLSYQCVMGVFQINTTTIYANAVDERMELLSNLDTNQKLIELEPLPDSGWLLSSEISTDTAHFTNKHLGLYFGNRFTLVLKEPVP